MKFEILILLITFFIIYVASFTKNYSSNHYTTEPNWSKPETKKKKNKSRVRFAPIRDEKIFDKSTREILSETTAPV